MEFGVTERITLMQLLPQEGDYLTYKILSELRTALAFSEEELKEFEMVVNGDKVTWNPDKATDKEVKVGDKGKEIIKAALKKLDDSGKISGSNVSLYEKFMLD